MSDWFRRLFIDDVKGSLSGGRFSIGGQIGLLGQTSSYSCVNIYLDGDTTGMTKDDAVMLDCLMVDEYGKVFFDGKSSTAWQGSGSLSYPNKNLSLKLKDNEGNKVKVSVFPDYEASTYHLKANYADYSMVRNSVGARLALEFDNTVFPVNAPLTVKSIPAIMYLNGEFNGCYTLNYKQDDDLFGMDSKTNPLTHIVYRSGLNGWNLSNFEYRSDGDETEETKAKLQTLLDFCSKSDATTFVTDFENHFDLKNAINYWLFAELTCASDNLLNNFTLATWDGSKWYMIWYDLDIIFGLFRNAGLSYHPSKPTTDLLPLQYTKPNPIWQKLYDNFFDEIKERYWELRNSGLMNPSYLVNKFRTFQTKWSTENITKERSKWTGRLNKTDDIDMMHGWITDRLAYLDEKYYTNVETEKTLESISATYRGGNVPAGTDVDNLTGISVTAHYSDGSTSTVTEYSLTGTITEGINTITVIYGDKTSTFAVVGVAESGDDEPSTDVELPTGYTRLAYIEGNGTQYIDTEKIIEHSYTTDGDEFYLEFALTSMSPSTQVLWGDNSVKQVGGTHVGNQFALQDGVLKDFVHCGALVSASKWQAPIIGKKYAYWCGYTPNENSHKCGLYDADGNTWSPKMYADELNVISPATNSMCIMGKVGNDGLLEGTTVANMRLYEFRQIIDGEKIIHMIPTLDADGKPCMYDLVAQKAHYNEGTGEFAYARIESNDMKLVNALVGTGTQWIDTGLKMTYPLSGYELKLVFELTDTSGNMVLMGENSVTQNQIAYLTSTAGIGYSRAIFPAVKDTKYTYVETNGIADLNGATANVSLTNISPNYTTCLFAKKFNDVDVEKNSIAKMKLYEFSYSEGGEEKIHLLPALDGKGVAGLYDTVSKSMFYSGSYAFEYEEIAGIALVGEELTIAGNVSVLQKNSILIIE